MTRLTSIFSVMICLLSGQLIASDPLTQSGLAIPNGRLAFSHDGNYHDPDDWGALAMNGILVWAANINTRVVHIDHSNHLGLNDPAMHSEMKTSASGIISRFGIASHVVFDNQTQLTAAIANFKFHAEQSSANNPLWYFCCGPMEVPWRMINAVNPAYRQYIHCVSHSTWNNTHVEGSDMTHTWALLKSDFPTVTFHKIADQNGKTANTPYDWNTPRVYWDFLRDSPHEPYRWVWSRDGFINDGKFDPSDAGMTYWFLSGGPNGGNPKSGWPEVRILLESVLSPGLGFNARADFTNINAGDVTYYKDNTFNALAIDTSIAANRDKYARAERTFTGTTGIYNVTIVTLTEEDGESTYKLRINGEIVGTFQNPRVGNSKDLKPYFHTWSNISIPANATIAVESNTHTNGLIPEGTGTAWSRGRWRQIQLSSATTAKPTVSWTKSSQASVNENGTLTVTAQLSATSGQIVAVPFTISGTATYADRTIATSPIFIAAGSTNGTATITIIADSLDENNETVKLTMGTPTNATKGAITVHTATITDDDAAPIVAFTKASSSGSELESNVTLPVSLSTASGRTVKVNYTVSGGTATGGGVDYTLSNGLLTFVAGETTKNISITVINDMLSEDDEIIEVTLSGPNNASLGAVTHHSYTILSSSSSSSVSSNGSESSCGMGSGFSVLLLMMFTVTIKLCLLAKRRLK